MNAENLESEIRALIVQQTGASPEKITTEIDLVDGLRIYGDDIWELLEAFATQFSVNLEGVRWYHHTGPEGCNPLWLFYKPWWARKTHVPIRLGDLMESARRGVWTIKYPEDERQT